MEIDTSSSSTITPFTYGDFRQQQIENLMKLFKELFAYLKELLLAATEIMIANQTPDHKGGIDSALAMFMKTLEGHHKFPESSDGGLRGKIIPFNRPTFS